jgi:hypothetical protein
LLKLLRERCKERAFNCVFMHHKKGFLLMIINIIWDAQSQRLPLKRMLLFSRLQKRWPIRVRAVSMRSNRGLNPGGQIKDVFILNRNQYEA